ncbi:MAG: CDP-diacylglycerol--serine O-phosphatidyltransferase [Candidatus Muiribacteriota bacterium]
MKKILWIIPSVLTSLSLMAGFLAIINVSLNNIKGAAWLIIFAIFMDALDGRVARLTKKETKFGQEYDSLADMVSFGVAPAFLIYFLMVQNLVLSPFSFVIAFSVVLCGGLRLARFNIDSKKEDSFKGMPLPGAAGIIASYVLFCFKYGIPFNDGLLIFITLWVSMLMVSNLPYPSGKVKKAGRANRKLIFLSLIALILITRFHIEFFAMIGLLYMCYGPLRFIFDGVNKEITHKY